jgi:CHC2 zinc finger
VPDVDFEAVRREITMEQVLDLLGFQPSTRSGVQWYGSCPLYASRSGRRRSLSVSVALGCCYCYGCRSHGNQLELWAAAIKLPLHHRGVRTASGMVTEPYGILTAAPLAIQRNPDAHGLTHSGNSPL